ncbi:unnamed protein product, partial [Phaeothamnion confervicola]
EPLVFRYPSLDLPTQNYPLTIPLSSNIDWLIPRLKLDVLHANHPFLLGQVAARKSRKQNIPLVFTYHTRYREYSHYVPALPTAMVSEFIGAYVGGYLAKCHVVVVPSTSIKELLAEKYNLTDGVHVIPTGLDLAKWAKEPSVDHRASLGTGTVLVSAGRLAPEKNFECLLRAFALLEGSPSLVILGDGTHRGALENLARELGVFERLHLVGSVSPAEVLAYFKAADLFVTASVTETQGLVTLEAMASGLPVAAVRASGTSDVVVNGESGLLTANDPAALAAAISRMLLDRDLLGRMAARSLDVTKAFDALVCAKRMLEVYGEAIERNAAGQRLKPVQPHVTLEDRWRAFIEGEDASS